MITKPTEMLPYIYRERDVCTMIIAFIIALCLNKCKITGLCSWEYFKTKTNKRTKKKILKATLEWNCEIRGANPNRGGRGRLTLVQAQHRPCPPTFFFNVTLANPPNCMFRVSATTFSPPTPSTFHARATVPLGWEFAEFWFNRCYWTVNTAGLQFG